MAVSGEVLENPPGEAEVSVEQVRSYWENNPLCAAAIPHQLGTAEYFRHYDRLREANESPEFSERLHEYRDFAGKRVLDIGCGNGYVLANYARHGAEVHGVDLTLAAVRLSRRRFELSGLEGDFQAGNAESLPFDAACFDCVCSMGVLHHTPDTEKAVEEAFRVLKPGGRLITMFYHRNSALYRVCFPLRGLLEGKSLRQLVNEVDGVGNPKGAVYSRKELARVLGDFEKVEMFAGLLRGWMVVPRFGPLIPDSLLSPFQRRFGWFLYAKGRKPR